MAEKNERQIVDSKAVGQPELTADAKDVVGDMKDYNLDDKEAKEIETDVEDGYSENSPYPEVRASVPPIDENIPVNTFRSWFLGIITTMILTALNQFFQLHTPPIFLSAYLAILLSLPVGHFMARILPERRFNVFGWAFTLNPGPFNRKEHTLIGIMAMLVTAFDNGSLASDVWVGFQKFMGIPISTGYKFMFLLTSQAVSFGMAGAFHTFLVEPSFCVWPSALPTCAVLHGFHDGKFQNIVANGWKIPRMRFFWIVFGIAALYQFIPGYLFTSLTTFAFVTWIRPNNVVLNQVFGATTGMDLIPLTLDWNQITGYLTSPLAIPYWAIANVLGGAVFFLWILSPILHWKNVWEGMYMPFSSSDTFDNTGASYNVTRVMNADYSLNNQAYHEYSPVFLSTTSVLSYGLGFGSITAILVHTFLEYRDVVWASFRYTIGRGEVPNRDVHNKLMDQYKQVPAWWYLVILAAMYGISVAFCYVYDVGLPWYGMILALAINAVLLIPVGLMQAMCNVTINTGSLAALIAGYIWPGQLMNNVVFKIFLLVSTFQGLGYIRDMKVAHYMKIPPRTTFAAQCCGIIVSWLTQTAVNLWAIGNVDGICTSESDFTCPLAAGYATNATFWALIGPTKLFGDGSMYRSILWFLLIGALLPVFVWYFNRRFPNTFMKKVHVPLIFASTSSIPPATASNYMLWGIIGLTFQGYIKRKYRAWWTKYNYILSAALDSALAVATFLIFFCLTYPGVVLDWWGNTIAYTTADAMGTPLKTVPEGGHLALTPGIEMTR